MLAHVAKKESLQLPDGLAQVPACTSHPLFSLLPVIFSSTTWDSMPRWTPLQLHDTPVHTPASFPQAQSWIPCALLRERAYASV